jgi:hypothetical protein
VTCCCELVGGGADGVMPIEPPHATVAIAKAMTAAR